MIPICPHFPLPICQKRCQVVKKMSSCQKRCQVVKKMSSCQKDVKLSKRCQVVKKMSNVKKSNTLTMEEVCLQHIPHITFFLNIYDIFAIYTRWNIYTNQMKVTNYTSWNIETKLMTLVTYTSRFRKLHLKLSTLPTCSDRWNRGVAHCMKVWGPCYFSPLSDWDSLVPLELACKGDT